MIWFVAVVILGRLVHCWHFDCISGIVGGVVAGVGVGRVAGCMLAFSAPIFFVAVLCCRAGRSVAVAVAV